MALEDYRGSMLGCSKCSYCKFIPLAKINGLKYADGCPSVAHFGFHTYSGGGRLTAALSLLEGRSGYTDKVRDMVYQCQLCGSCDVTCKVCRFNMEPLAALEEIRVRFVEDGQTLPAHDRTIENLRAENNMMSVPACGRGDWADGLGLKDLSKESAETARNMSLASPTLGLKDLSKERAETLFFAGCGCSFDEGMKKAARAAARVLNAGGADLGVMGDAEICCGGEAYNLGYREDFERQARANIAMWKEAGVKRIVTPCADCYRAFNWLYRQREDFDIETLHAVQLAEALIADGSLKPVKPLPFKATYHDPCRLGRLGKPYEKWDGTTTKIFGTIPKNDPPKPRYGGVGGVYDAPRNVLAAIPGLDLVEMVRSREASWCCGAGAGVHEAFPDFGAATAISRLEEAADTGAEILVSACPRCEREFAVAAGSKEREFAVAAGSGDLKIYDVMELLEMALGGGEM